jgi:hypothetical protein
MDLDPKALQAAIEYTKPHSQFASDPDAECALEMGEMDEIVEGIITVYLESVKQQYLNNLNPKPKTCSEVHPQTDVYHTGGHWRY